MKSQLFLNLIIKGWRRGEESEKRVKWRRKSILHLPHLSKHLPNPAPPLPVSARHCGLIPPASFSSCLHQEQVSFQCSWPLSEDWCPWDMRQFKNPPLCTSEELREVCVSSHLTSSIHSHHCDTATATCCRAIHGDAGAARRWAAATPCSQPAVARQGCSSTGEGTGHQLMLLWLFPDTRKKSLIKESRELCFGAQHPPRVSPPCSCS